MNTNVAIGILRTEGEDPMLSMIIKGFQELIFSRSVTVSISLSIVIVNLVLVKLQGNESLNPLSLWRRSRQRQVERERD